MLHKRLSPGIALSRCLLAGCLVLLAVNILPLPAAQAFAGTWTSIASMNDGRYGHTATLLLSGPDAGKVLVVGGSMEVSIPGTGGLTGLADVDLPAGQTAELYDPANPSAFWSLTASLSTPRVFHAAAWINSGKVLVAGGANSVTTDSLNSAEIFDPVGGPSGTPIWIPTVNNMAHPHTSATATFLDDGRVLIVGGYSGSIMSGDATDTVEIFNPATGTWSSARHLNHARSFHTATLIHPAGAPTGKVMVTGGSSSAYSSSGDTLNSVEIYDPIANTWTDVQPLHQARSDHSATLMADGRVLIVGGNDPASSEDETYLASTEIYDPDANSWTDTTPLGVARGFHTASLLQYGPQNGKILVAGGANSTSSVIYTELYDPATATWLDAGDIMDPYGSRVSHTATLLLNGQMLLAGGFLGIGSEVSADDSAEVYSPALPQTITVVEAPPSTAIYLSTFTVSATAPGGPVTYSSGSPSICSVVINAGSATFTMLSGSGVCLVQFDQPGNETYAAAPRVSMQVTAQKIDQSISVSQAAPAAAAYHTTFQVAASASSGLGVVYGSGSTSVCTTSSDGTFTMQSGLGTCLVWFEQPGDNNYNPAPQITSEVAAQQASQSITFNASGTRPFGADFSISASTNSSLPILFDVGIGNPCEVASSNQDPGNPTITHAVIHPTGLGDCAITASQIGDDNYTPAAPVAHTLTIVKGDQVITVTQSAPINAAYQSTFSVAATAPGGEVTYSSGSPTICSNVGAEFTMLSGSGVCRVQFDQAGNAYYNPAPRYTQQVTAKKIDQSIQITQDAPDAAAYHTSFQVMATASSTLAVVYSSGSPEICSVGSNGTFTMQKGTGTCLVQFDQPGNDNFNPAPQITREVDAQKIDQTITVTKDAPGTAAYHTSFQVAGTASSGLSLVYTSGNTAVCTVGSNGTFTMQSGTGICPIRFDQPGDDNYNPAPRINQQVDAERIDQAISVTQDAPDSAAYHTSFQVAATSNSTLAVVYSSGSPGVCTLGSNGTFTMQSGTGVCLVHFDQPGDDNYNPAPQIMREVEAQKIDQSITITQNAPGTAAYHATFQVAATASSGLGVVFSSGSSDVCTVGSNGIFTMQKGTGTCIVQFDQPGDDNYNSALRKTSTVSAQKAGQNITFNLAAATYIFGDPDFTLTGTSDSGLPVSFDLSSGDPCTLTGSLVHIEHVGTCTITASQTGDGNYEAAAPVTHTITILKKTLLIVLDGLTRTVDGQPKVVTATPEVPGITVIVTYTGTGSTIYGPSTLAPSLIGTYSVSAVIDDPDYQGSVAGELVINPVKLFLPAIFHP